jgi:hypothetical protein
LDVQRRREKKCSGRIDFKREVDITEHLYGPWESGWSEQVTSGITRLSIDRDELLIEPIDSGNRIDRKKLLNLREFVGVHYRPVATVRSRRPTVVLTPTGGYKSTRTD